MLNTFLILLVTVTLAGCTSVVQQGGTGKLESAEVRLFLAPFTNATDDEHASRALTELTATALLERGVPLVQTEPGLVRSRAENAAGPDGLYLDTARTLQATHLLVGTVHEYRYKTDLDGDPTVGVTLRLVDARDGRTLWQGSSSRVSVLFASLSSTAMHAVRDLVKRMPLPKTPARPAP